MIMLDDNHPDIEEFITVKRTAGKIEHANLSVCISDKFMQAVKDDADWDLIWQGEVKKTIRARSLWDLICTSAWESAEPGMVFMDRYNKLSNTWYYEDIRCVNPCGDWRKSQNPREILSQGFVVNQMVGQVSDGKSSSPRGTLCEAVRIAAPP